MYFHQIQLFNRQFFKSAELWSKVVRSSWPELLAIFIFIHLQTIGLHSLLSLAPDQENLQLMGKLNLGLLSLLEAFFIIILVPFRVIEAQQGLAKQNYFLILRKHLIPITLEGLRMTGFVILWGLLFILPGLFKQMRWYFMPFVVLTDPLYEKGEVDVLARSNQLAKGITLLIAFVALFDFFIQYAFDAFGQLLVGPLQYAGIFMAGLFTLGISIYTNILLFCIYQQRANEIPHQEEITQPTKGES